MQCSSDAQCTGSKPHCDTNFGVCVECVGDQECGGGVCAFGACCGKNACATNGVECGTTLDLGCILQPIQCGACNSGKLCVSGKCLPPPVNSCDPNACASKKCGYVPESNSYECIYKSSQCSASNTKCDPGYRCVSSSVNGTKYYSCEQYCVTQADCTNATQCTPLYGPTSYGSCQ